MTDTEVIKALECCSNDKGIASCVDCPLANYSFNECGRMLPKDALDFINRQKAEIERLEQILDKRCDVCPAVTSAIKEYSKYLVDKSIKGFLRADDIVDCCFDFIHQPTKIEHSSLCETATYESR